MTRAAFALLLGASVVAQQPTFRTPEQPTFRSTTELVRIDALVERDGRPIVGLTAEDFEVLDDGKPQRVMTLRQMGPVAVGVALDTSGSMTGDRFARASEATLVLLQQLHADESSVVVGFSNLVTRLIPAGTPVANWPRLLGAAKSGGSTGLADGTYAAVLACDTGPGSKLLVLLTDGRNYGSWLSARSAIDAARRHEVVIYPVGVGVDDELVASSARGSRMPADLGSTEHGGVPLQMREVTGGDGLRLLKVIANATGGRAIKADWTTDLTATFRQILEEYRQRYIIAFSPEGVPKGDGWHTLEVRLKRGGTANVHARAGYWAR
jgi:Ca-activated chloride channel family protein